MEVVFRNVERSILAKEIVTEKLEPVLEKFPGLQNHRVRVVLSMDNAPDQPGPDMFHVRILISGPRFRSIVLKRSSHNLYFALAELADRLLERLNRYGDKQRVKKRSLARHEEQKVLFSTEQVS